MTSIDPGRAAAASHSAAPSGAVAARATAAWTAVALAPARFGGQLVLPLPDRPLGMRAAQMQQPDPRPEGGRGEDGGRS